MMVKLRFSTNERVEPGKVITGPGLMFSVMSRSSCFVRGLRMIVEADAWNVREVDAYYALSLPRFEQQRQSRIVYFTREIDQCFPLGPIEFFAFQLAPSQIGEVVTCRSAQRIRQGVCFFR